MTKWHNGPKGPGVCKATKGNCPYGGASDHYESKDEAMKVYEEKMSSEYGVLPASSKSDFSNREFDELSNKIDFGCGPALSVKLKDGSTMKGDVSKYKRDRKGEQVFKVGKVWVHKDNIESFEEMKTGVKKARYEYDNPNADEIQREFDDIEDRVNDGEVVRGEFRLLSGAIASGQIKEAKVGISGRHTFKIGNRSVYADEIKDFTLE